MKKIIFIKEIGEVTIIKSKRSKKIRISISHNAEIKVTLPNFLKYVEAERFIVDKKEWVIKSVLKMKNTGRQKTIFNEDSTYNTFSHVIKFQKKNLSNGQIELNIKKDFAYISFPDNADIESNEFQKGIRNMIDEVLRNEAKRYLPFRVKYFAEKHNFNYNKVTVRKAKTRWGSCSGNNNISLNIHLMRLPQHLLDYVILHELSHTVEKNHAQSFWDLLDKVSDGKAKQLSKELKNYSTAIF